MASEVRFTESKTPLDFSIKYFIKSITTPLFSKFVTTSLQSKSILI